ncbi:MAG: hypothetical protein LUG99_16155 [Lachnospiraceae bacterium]|nr:hypothetical protein [Lachnospiraceae bacterium]
MNQLLGPGAKKEDFVINRGKIRKLPYQFINACEVTGSKYQKPRFQRCCDVFILHDPVEFVKANIQLAGQAFQLEAAVPGSMSAVDVNVGKGLEFFRTFFGSPINSDRRTAANTLFIHFAYMIICLWMKMIYVTLAYRKGETYGKFRRLKCYGRGVNVGK